MSPSIDFFGHNSYTRAVVRDDPGSALTGAATVDSGNPKTAMGWEIYPDHLYDALTRITRDYGRPAIYITENGASFDDVVRNGAVDDPQRTEYLREHLSKRFGIVHFDFATQHRIFKASGRFFAVCARANGVAA